MKISTIFSITKVAALAETLKNPVITVANVKKRKVFGLMSSPE
ncbi:hypothetical protein JCM19239_2815 [Vibrio variabilis]|uniref:Uncharacterized protein n=1 Tax=Vibrio variabilis TaxID=990271 RepID=A0ABQ0JIP2_9VIBR|nr:hypothetical protein JCM19239_2815 [Vibrio variabilis]